MSAGLLRVLVINADAVQRACIHISLSKERYEPTFFQGIDQALHAMQEAPFHMALVSGPALVRLLHDAHPELPIVLMGAGALHADVPVDAVLPVPFDQATFEAKASDVLRRSYALLSANAEAQAASKTFVWRAFRAQVESLMQRLPKISHYRLLEVSRTASLEQVESAYQKRMHEYSPENVFGLKDETLLRQMAQIRVRIEEAKAVLCDEDKRQVYDAGLSGTITPTPAPPPKDLLRHKREKDDPLDMVETAEGRRHVAQAVMAERRGDLAGALMHLGLALRVEPQNERLQKKYVALRSAQGGG